ncbi:uncharacterized protein LOC135823883 isoform X2 [Sycon ciliatum]|uniref:uncharacterized protein LOC135823883 isoform X1 n=1 Tax=Sycon ciliatum TaxID=27933 RepID=UPI0031F62DBE
MAVKPHFKFTNRFLYLLVGSNHPCSMGKGVFTGELIRIRRSSTLDHHYEAAAERPKQAFQARVYKRSIFHLSDPYTRNGCAGKSSSIRSCLRGCHFSHQRRLVRRSHSALRACCFQHDFPKENVLAH